MLLFFAFCLCFCVVVYWKNITVVVNNDTVVKRELSYIFMFTFDIFITYLSTTVV